MTYEIDRYILNTDSDHINYLTYMLRQKYE